MSADWLNICITDCKGVLAARRALWIADTVLKHCCRQPMHIHINETKEQGRERNGEKAWSLAWRDCTLKSWIRQSRKQQDPYIRPQNPQRVCMGGWLTSPPTQGERKEGEWGWGGGKETEDNLQVLKKKQQHLQRPNYKLVLLKYTNMLTPSHSQMHKLKETKPFHKSSKVDATLKLWSWLFWS